MITLTLLFGMTTSSVRQTDEGIGFDPISFDAAQIYNISGCRF
jgi:hypothetical protein